MLKTVCLPLLAGGILLMSGTAVYAESLADEDAVTAEVIKAAQNDPVPSTNMSRRTWYENDATYGSLTHVPLTVMKVAYVDTTAQMRSAQRMVEILSMQPAILHNVTYHVSGASMQTVCADVVYHTSGFGHFVGQMSHGKVVAFRLDATDGERNRAGCGDGSTRAAQPAVVAEAY